ncbi:hypothetical protein MKW98_012177 [Papaver atlanticum]|uniref:Zinc-finger domain-containing protein n=1 Tax=Papaver atlanticum TaxID=357466 RepID=A0AAD4SZ98_9MAGN|nr:hypothetical protein MKW98_012177 [Papaver atlanticum]
MGILIQEIEEVRANKKWMCPRCIENKGIRPYWICNSSLCLKKRKMAPTGIAIFEAREMFRTRSPAIVIAYLMKCKGWRLAQSYQRVKERRPFVEISSDFVIYVFLTSR